MKVPRNHSEGVFTHSGPVAPGRRNDGHFVAMLGLLPELVEQIGLFVNGAILSSMVRNVRQNREGVLSTR